MLAKRDRDRNGRLDPEEREAAYGDSAFIKLDLDAIDTNHNGWLDANELAWFDADGDRKLAPNEQRAVELAQGLMAERLLRRFDADEDDTLDRAEFNDLWPRASFARNDPMPALFEAFNLADRNHDGHLDVNEITVVLEQETQRSLLRQLAANPRFFMQWRTNLFRGTPQSRFETDVEAYWRQERRTASRATPEAAQRISRP